MENVVLLSNSISIPPVGILGGYSHARIEPVGWTVQRIKPRVFVDNAKPRAKFWSHCVVGQPLRSSADAVLFFDLADRWKKERGATSSIAEMSACESYRRIMGMGPAALPFILESMKKKQDHWFVALRAITGADPVPDEARGNLAAMTKAWLAWAQERYYVG
jgi:hypothetical protein